MKDSIRKQLTQQQVESLKPFNKMANKASDIFGVTVKDYWFQITIEITRDCDANSYAIIEAHKR